MTNRSLQFLVTITLILFASSASSESIWDKLKKSAEDVAVEVANDQIDKATNESTPPIDPLQLLDPKTQNCRGRVGLGCGGFGDAGIKNPANVEHPCYGNDDLICITSSASVGAIKHDICCDAERAAGRTGHFCGFNITATACKAEWDIAKKERGAERFTFTWKYRIGNQPTTQPHNWWFGMIPDGTKVNQVDPQADRTFCHANAVVQENAVWVCGSAPDQAVPSTPSTVPGSKGLEPRNIPVELNPQYPDVFGIQIGMSSLQVVSVLQKRNSKAIIDLVGMNKAKISGGGDSEEERKIGVITIDRQQSCSAPDSWHCARYMQYLIKISDKEIHNLRIVLDKPFPDKGYSVVSRLTFNHKVPKDKRFDYIEFLKSKYGEPDERFQKKNKSTSSTTNPENSSRRNRSNQNLASSQPIEREEIPSVTSGEGFRWWAIKESSLGLSALRYRKFKTPYTYGIDLQLGLHNDNLEKWKAGWHEYLEEQSQQRHIKKEKAEKPF